MSTDRKRLTSAIQRIAREDPDIRKLLDDFRNSGGKPSETASSGSGAEDRQTCCDGSTSGSANPGSSTKDPGDGGEDASDGLNPDDPAKIENGPGSLTGVKDCVSGEPVCFEGSDWIPPEGWESPTTPPLDPTYTAGEYWAAFNNGYHHQSPTEGGTLAGVNTEYPFYDYCYTNLDFVIICATNDGSIVSTSYQMRNPSCAEGSAEEYCNPDESDLREDAWPEDGCVNLAQKGGKLVGSKYDPENDGSYSKPRSSIELCDDFGNSFELAPSASGGWKTISAQNPGDGYLYDSSGKQIARISESEYSDPNV